MVFLHFIENQLIANKDFHYKYSQNTWVFPSPFHKNHATRKHEHTAGRGRRPLAPTGVRRRFGAL